MRILVAFLFCTCFANSVFSQKLDDFGRIIINTYIPEELSIPTGAKRLLKTRLTSLTTKNGMGGSQINPRFVITPVVNIGTKDIIAGPPQMIAQNIELTLIIGDAIKNVKYASTSIELKGVGTNLNKAFIHAFKRVNPNNQKLKSFIEEGKKKIIEYYETQCDFIIKDALTLVKQGDYDEAIYNLSLVPDVCQTCYYNCLDTLAWVYQEKIDADCKIKLKKAKSMWVAGLNSKSAENAFGEISKINAQAKCQEEVELFINQINQKLTADAKARWAFKMKQYNDKVAKERENMRIAEEKSIRDDEFREKQAARDSKFREKQAARDSEFREKQASRNFKLNKLRVNAYKTVATEYARNQPKQVTYNRILFR